MHLFEPRQKRRSCVSKSQFDAPVAPSAVRAPQATKRSQCKVLQQTPASSFDHLAGASHHRYRQLEAECSRGFEVHDELEPRWAFDGEVGRLGTTQNPTNVTATTAKHIGKVRPIGDETSCIHMRPVKIYRGQASLP